MKARSGRISSGDLDAISGVDYRQRNLSSISLARSVYRGRARDWWRKLSPNKLYRMEPSFLKKKKNQKADGSEIGPNWAKCLTG